jgi:hypothetical protein
MLDKEALLEYVIEHHPEILEQFIKEVSLLGVAGAGYAIGSALGSAIRSNTGKNSPANRYKGAKAREDGAKAAKTTIKPMKPFRP